MAKCMVFSLGIYKHTTVYCAYSKCQTKNDNHSHLIWILLMQAIFLLATVFELASHALYAASNNTSYVWLLISNWIRFLFLFSLLIGRICSGMTNNNDGMKPLNP